ncbi:MAG: PEP-CTERM sorting domain-containing protein [Planctomycetia bacterium]|nr:PEP-CTERM sorting domain-containing protein [Planctomycetia bacterium]
MKIVKMKWVAAICAVGLLLGGASVASAINLSEGTHEELMPMTSTDITVLSFDYDTGDTVDYGQRRIRVYGYYTNDWNNWYTDGAPNPEAPESSQWMMPIRFENQHPFAGEAGDWLHVETDYGPYYCRLGDVGFLAAANTLHYEVRLDRYRGLFEWRINGVKLTFVNDPGNTNSPQPNGYILDPLLPEIVPNTFFDDEELVQGEEHEFIGYQHQIDNGWGAYLSSSEKHLGVEAYYGVGGAGEYYLIFDGDSDATVNNIKPGIPGDANLDGTVDDKDASILGANWRETIIPMTWQDGDFNGDTVVNDQDAAILAANWGKTASLLPVTAEAVPEPSTWCLLAGALAMLAVWRRKSR